MTDQANEAIDPMDTAASLIANSFDESDDLEEDEDQDGSTEDTGEETEDADTEEEGATEAPKEVVFAGQKFDLPANTPPEVVEQIAEVGKQLQGDYTRKTQELASREKQAAEIVQNELNQGRQHIQQAIQQARAVIQAVGGFDPAHLAELAQTDPAAWVQANARQQQLQAYLAQLQQQEQAVAQQQEQVKAQQQEAAKQEAWQRLNAEGITREGLAKLWGDALQVFPSLTNEKLSAVMDADSWLVLRDAVAYRQLKAQKPAISQKVAAAPKLPQAKTPMPQEVRQRLDARKAVTRKGGASMRDLAAFIDTNKR